MPHRQSLLPDGGMLLGIVSTQGVDVPARPAEARLWGVVIARQLERAVLRVPIHIGLAQAFHIRFSLVETFKLAQHMQLEKRDSAPALYKPLSQFQVFRIPGQAV
jgi:hypothetical protein